MKFELDEYAHLDSPIHRWNPRYKLIGLLILIFSFALVEQLRLAPLMIGVTVLLYVLARLPLSFWLQRVHYPGLFLLAFVALLPFTSGQTVIWQWEGLSLRQEGITAVMLVVSRFLSITTIGLILFGTMPFLTTVKTLRSLGLPAILTDMLLLSYRYLFEIADDLVQMQRSMRLRGVHHRNRCTCDVAAPAQLPALKNLNRWASLVGTLLIRSFEQSERIYKAMQLRGYGHVAAQPMHLRRGCAITPQAARHFWHEIGLAIVLLIAASFALTEMLT